MRVLNPEEQSTALFTSAQLDEFASGVELLVLASPLAAATVVAVERTVVDAARAAGFIVGFIDGMEAGVSSWWQDIEETIERLPRKVQAVAEAAPDIAVLLAAVLATGFIEYVARPLTETNPTGLSPKTEQIVNETFDLPTFRPAREMLLWLRDWDRRGGAKILRELVPSAAEIVELVGTAAVEFVAQSVEAWLAKLAALSSPFEQGKHAGHPVGRVTLEVIRAVVEPGWLQLVETAGAVGVPPP